MPILMIADQLKPGMFLGANIFNKHAMLLPHGHELTDEDIDSLKRIMPDEKIHIEVPALDTIADFDDITRAQKISAEVRARSAAMFDQVNTVIRSGKTISTDNMTGMKKAIRETIAYMIENPVAMAILEQSSNWHDYLQEHSANVFYLSLLIGNKLINYVESERVRLSSANHIYNATDLAPLGAAALFHDVAMVELSELYHKKEPLTDQEQQELLNHPHTGANMLPLSISSMVRAAVRDHHENHQGTGYPTGMPGDKIGVFPRIIRIADAFCSATADRGNYQKKSQTVALYEMLYGDCQEFYDPEILHAFSSLVPPFPIGAKLKLHDNRCAVVLKHNEKRPFYPVVIIAFDEFNQHIPKSKLEKPFLLGNRKDIKIKSFGSLDLSFLNEKVYNLTPQQNQTKTFSFNYP